MITWWIRISEIEDETKQTAFFVGQEVVFYQFYQEVNKIPYQNGLVKIRYELHQTKNHQDQAIGLFTWESKDQLSLLDSISTKLEMAVRNKLFDKKKMKEYLKLLTNDVSLNQKKSSTKQPSQASNSYPPLNQQEVKTEENDVAVQGELSKVEEDVEEALSIEKVPILPIKTKTIKKVRPKKDKQETFYFKLCQLVQKVPLETMKKQVLSKWKVITSVFFALLIVGTIAYVAVTFVSNQETNVAKESFQELKEEKSYKKMAKEYPEKFWDWEESQVEAMQTDTLMDVYEDYPDMAIAYDIAFLGKAYSKVIQMYQDSPEKLRMNETRYAFLGFSYLQEEDLPNAEKMAEKSGSKALYGQLALAYLHQGNDKKAEECNEIAKDDEISVEIKDYQLVKTTLDEVNKQLSKNGLNENIRAELLESKQVLEEELQKIKNGEDEQ
ncbi:hypothetical protein [Listeria seeligeri]|uniref:hypothetical protein n=1 Tax=Listeria seeligeri TaxID=1640 RepID=UPI0022EACACF|nr:hypothetical protein [Listeria seeligeri]